MNANRGLLAGPLIALVTSAGGCEMNRSGTELASSPDILAKRVEKAHGITAWRNIAVIDLAVLHRRAVQASRFGNSPRFRATGDI